MKSLSIIILSLFFSLSLLAQHVRMSDFENGQVTFVGQGFTKTDTDRQFQVQLYINGSAYDQIVTNPNGSFSYTTARGAIRTNDAVTLQINQWYSETSHLLIHFTIPMSEELKEEIRRFRAKIPGYAQQQANTLANRVAPDMAKIARWKRTFGTSFIAAYNSYSSVSGDGNRSYIKGKEEGKETGYSYGKNVGKSDGISNATRAAQERISNAFHSSIDDPKRTAIQNLNSEIPNASYDGNREPESRNPQDRLISYLNDQINSDRSVSMRYFYTSAIGHIQLEEANQYAQGSIDWERILSPREAYDGWLNGRFDGNYDYTLYYNQLMTYELKELFAAEFMNAYSNIIARKIYENSAGRDSNAYDIGLEAGMKLGEAESFEMGRVDGFNSRFGPGADSGFSEVYAKKFLEVYKQTLSYFKSNVILENLQLELLEENDNYLWERGEKLGIKISGLRNAGGKDAVINIVAIDTEDAQALKTFQFKLPALTSLKGTNKIYKEIAQINNHLLDEKQYKISLKINEDKHELPFYVGWKNVISDVKVKLFDANKNGLWEKGEEIGVIVTSAKNRSKVNAELNVKLKGEGIQLLTTQKKLAVSAQNQISKNEEFYPMARINKNVEENKRYPLNLKIGPMEFSLSFMVGWVNLLETYASEPRADLKASIQKAIIAEWNAAKASGQRDNWYKYGRNGKKTRLEQLVETAYAGDVTKYRSLADKKICDMVSGYYWVTNPWNYNFALSFKKLYSVIHPSCK